MSQNAQSVDGISARKVPLSDSSDLDVTKTQTSDTDELLKKLRQTKVKSGSSGSAYDSDSESAGERPCQTWFYISKLVQRKLKIYLKWKMQLFSVKCILSCFYGIYKYNTSNVSEVFQYI